MINIILNSLITQTIIPYLLIIISILISVAFMTVFERQLLGALQRRQGPNVVGFFGLFQALTDGLKLLLKESIIPKSSDLLIFCLAPIFNFT
jgi:NADH:ubiquinone oxidoreductase subunit H